MKLRIPQYTPVSWLLAAIWLFLALWGNTPFFQPHPKTNPQYDLRGYWVQSTKMSLPAYEYTALVGFPMNYVHIEKPSYRICKLSVLALVADLICAILAIIAITGLSERFLKTFSIRNLFILTAIIALVVKSLPYFTPNWGIIVFINGMSVFFIVPILIWAIMAVCSKILKRKPMRENAT